MISELYKKINYKSDTPYIISRYIREYDISKANINILYSLKLISEQEYRYLYNANRMERQIRVGLLQQQYPEITKALQEGIIEAKKNFFISNNIQDHQVLAIKNDAIFLIDKIALNTKFGMVEFMNKNTYTSYYKLPYNNIELFYYIDMANGVEKLDVKGIKEETLLLHENYFLEFLKVLFCSAETEPIEDVINLLVTFYENYLNLNLDINYYREFNSESCIRLKKMSKLYSFKADFLEECHKEYIDICYNLNILRHLHQIYSGLLFSRNMRRK